MNKLTDALAIVVEPLMALIKRKADRDELPDAVINPATAMVGQTIVVKTVNKKGKPTEWKASDMETGLPEVDGPYRQLVTDMEGKIKWENSGKETLLINATVQWPYPSSNKYANNIGLADVDIVEGETYSFHISPTGGGGYYEAVETDVSAVAVKTNDRYGNTAYEFAFDDVALYKNSTNEKTDGILHSITFNSDYVYIYFSKSQSSINMNALTINTDIPRITTAYRDLVVWSSTADSTKRYKISVDDTGALTATEVI